MNFNDHSDLKGYHAFLGASKYHWIRYDGAKLDDAYLKHLATQRGTKLHEFACECIELGQKLPKSNKTLNLYVNDAIGFKMSPEVTLFFSENCFGTADALSFRKNFLRIHDLKTGITEAHMDQLMVYSALFCLEYSVNPCDIGVELRIYQSNQVVVHEPDPEDVQEIMNKIITFDKRIEKLKMGE